jgi:hypothetical protein
MRRAVNVAERLAGVSRVHGVGAPVGAGVGVQVAVVLIRKTEEQEEEDHDLGLNLGRGRGQGGGREAHLGVDGGQQDVVLEADPGVETGAREGIGKKTGRLQQGIEAGREHAVGVGVNVEAGAGAGATREVDVRNRAARAQVLVRVLEGGDLDRNREGRIGVETGVGTERTTTVGKGSARGRDQRRLRTAEIVMIPKPVRLPVRLPVLRMVRSERLIVARINISPRLIVR